MTRHLSQLSEEIERLNSRDFSLLWLEGAHSHTVDAVRLAGSRLILSFTNNITRIVPFERYVFTNMGFQFWSKGRPGVLYKWEQVERT
jgi:hypothetical protein